MHYHLTDVGTNVWVGDFLSCNDRLHDFDLSIHIWRNANVGENRICNRVKNNLDKGIVVKYRENDPLHTMSVPIRDVVQYASQEGKLLVHCAGGVCRSTTLALIAKMARGCDKYQAISDIYKGTWETYRYTPELYNHVVKDIFLFFDMYTSETWLM